MAETRSAIWTFKIVDESTIHLTCQWKGLGIHTAREITVKYDKEHFDIRSNECPFIPQPKQCTDSPFSIWPHSPFFPLEN